MDTKALKDKILQLAIQGKLVEQDKNDEPASALLQRINEERDKLVKEKKIRKLKKLPPIEEEEKPFDVPDGWEWVRLGKIGNVINGNSINAKIKQEKYSNIEKGYSYIATKDIDLETSKIDYNNGIRIPFEEKEIFKIAPKNSILICSEGGSAGKKVGFIEKEVAFVNKLFNFNGYINNINRYIYYLWKSPFFNEKFENVKTGIIGGVSINNFKNILIPLPPLAEQKRIVEKVDQLFALIDELDSNKEDLLEVINLTRNQVLQEAIQGKLVEQNPEDEPASVLIQRIKEERDKLVKEKKIRKPKKLPPIEEEEKPFDIPEGWEWVRLGEIALVNMGQSPKGDTVNNKEGMEFHQGKIYFGERYLNKSDKYTINPKKVAQPGDILLSVRAPVGTINITDREVCIGRGLCAISSLGDIINDYCFYVIVALDKYLIKRATGTTFLAVTASTVNEMIIPLPPLTEQKRIVEKVDMIMDMLDKLEKELIINI